MDDIIPPQADGLSSETKAGTSASRVITRFAVMVLALIALDIALGSLFPPPAYEPDWRLPRQMPTSEMGRLVAHIDMVAADSHPPIVAFVGASPTWGAGVRSATQTVPAAYRRDAQRSGRELLVYNLASNGQLLGDEYFVARRAAGFADVVFVQLTYSAFSPAWRENAQQRYPELSRLLGVPVDKQTASILGLEPTPAFDANGFVDRWLQRHWRLWGLRDAIGRRFFGGPPENALRTRWEKATSRDYAEEIETVSDGTPFDELLPDVQMMMVDQFAATAKFRLRKTDSELRMLGKMASDLEGSQAKVIFFLSPMNVDALTGFDAFDAKAYAANVSVLRNIVESHGLQFIDMNTDPLPSSAFVDLNHTTPRGSRLVGAALWRVRGAGE